MANIMQFAGTIESEEMMCGELADGRTIMVDMCSKYEYAPEELRDNPEYWLQRLETGEFDDPENYPVVWTIKDGKREWRDFPLAEPATTITFTSEYAMKEFEYYYEDREQLFSSLDVERNGNILTVYKFFGEETIEEMKRDFSIVEMTA
jgi:hypothetical protein